MLEKFELECKLAEQKEKLYSYLLSDARNDLKKAIVDLLWLDKNKIVSEFSTSHTAILNFVKVFNYVHELAEDQKMTVQSLLDILNLGHVKLQGIKQ